MILRKLLTRTLPSKLLYSIMYPMIGILSLPFSGIDRGAQLKCIMARKNALVVVNLKEHAY